MKDREESLSIEQIRNSDLYEIRHVMIERVSGEKIKEIHAQLIKQLEIIQAQKEEEPKKHELMMKDIKINLSVLAMRLEKFGEVARKIPDKKEESKNGN